MDADNSVGSNSSSSNKLEKPNDSNSTSKKSDEKETKNNKPEFADKNSNKSSPIYDPNAKEGSS